MQAFLHSTRLGMAGLELDVHRTADNLMVVCHDPDLHRITGQHHRVAEVKYEEILEYGSQINAVYTRETFKKVNKDNEKPPLFEEVLIALKDESVFLNVDVKSNLEADLQEVCRLVKLHGFENRVIIGAILNNDTDIIIKKEGVNAPVYFSGRQVVYFLLATIFGILPFVPFRHDVLEITGPFKTMKNNDLYDSNWKMRFFFGILRILRFIVPLLNWHLNRRGIPVFYWTLNHEEDFDFAIWLGANGIMTDAVTRLKLYLTTKGLF